MNIPLEVYQRYINMGWSVIPWKLESVDGSVKKSPVVKWREYQNRLPTSLEVSEWAGKYNAIALVTGKQSGVVVVDIDEVDQSKYPYLISPVRVRSAFSGGRHYYYKYDSSLKNFGPQAKIEGVPMDYRGEGGVVILPGSNLGEFKYEWEAFEPEILTAIPPEVYKKLKNPEKKFEKNELVRFDDLHSTGDRNQSATQVAGKLLEGMKQELWEVAGWTSLLKWNETQCDPPLDEQELRGVFESIAGKEARNRVEDIIWKEEALGFTEQLREVYSRKKTDPIMSGYTKLDRKIGGFLHSNSYLVTGLEKSGKSSWLMKMIQSQLERGMVVGYVNTELPQEEFVNKMTGYWKKKAFSQVTESECIEWSEKFATKLRYIGIETMPSQEKMIEMVQGFVRDGIECLVFDNITSWGNKLNENADSWQVTADLADSLIKMTKRSKIVTFMVRHLNPNIVDNAYKEKGGLATIIKNKEYWKIFEEQVSVVKRPTTANIYGGGQISSQMSGTIIIWRPYQKFSETTVSQRTAIMIDSFRQAPNAMIPADFIGEKGLFVEQESFNNAVMFADAMGGQ